MSTGPATIARNATPRTATPKWWIVPDMPRVWEAYVDCVTYLHPSEEAALADEHVGGCGFIVGTEFHESAGLA